VIELVTTLADETAEAQRQERMRAEYTRRRVLLRETVRDALKCFDVLLERHEQTTHGSTRYHAASIEDVANALVELWANPSSFTTSELSQTIGGFLKAAKAWEAST
jgi:hypothetical protein